MPTELVKRSTLTTEVSKVPVSSLPCSAGRPELYKLHRSGRCGGPPRTYSCQRNESGVHWRSRRRPRRLKVGPQGTPHKRHIEKFDATTNNSKLHQEARRQTSYNSTPHTRQLDATSQIGTYATETLQGGDASRKNARRVGRRVESWFELRCVE